MRAYCHLALNDVIVFSKTRRSDVTTLEDVANAAGVQKGASALHVPANRLAA